MKHVIDGHGHVVPDADDIPLFMKEKEIFRVEDNFMKRGKNKRPVSHPGFFIKERLERMERENIAHTVVYNLSQLYCNDLTKALAVDVIKWQNEYSASLQAQYPSKITGGIVINPAYVDESLTEIEKGVKNNLSIVFMCSHYKGESDAGYTAVGEDKNIEPILAEINKQKLALQIHPYEMEHIIYLEDTSRRHWMLGMPFLTADAHAMITSHDYHNMYPDIRYHFAHAGKFGGVSYGRRKQGFEGRPDLFPGCKDPMESIGATNIFYDTLTHDPEFLKFLIDREGLGQFAGGLDSLYPLGDFDIKGGYKPYKTLHQALNRGLITERDFNQICYDNNIRRVGGNMKSRIQGK